MQFSTVLFSVFAALSAAAPSAPPSLIPRSTEKPIYARTNATLGGAVAEAANNTFALPQASSVQFGSQFGAAFNPANFNNLNLGNAQLAYFAALSFFNPAELQVLALQQNLALDNFQNIFVLQNGQNFGIAELLQLQSLSVLGWLSAQGLLQGVNFNGVQFPSALSFGVAAPAIAEIVPINVNLGSNVLNQIAGIVQQAAIPLQ